MFESLNGEFVNDPNQSLEQTVAWKCTQCGAVYKDHEECCISCKNTDLIEVETSMFATRQKRFDDPDWRTHGWI